MTLPTALLFDLDGTLIDSLPQVTAMLNKALADDGAPPLPAAQVRGMVGRGALPLAEMALEAVGRTVSGSAAEALRDRFIAHYRAEPVGLTRLFPGAREVLELYWAQRVPMGVCTNKPLATTAPVLDALDLSRYFSAVVCGDRVPHPKPDPRHIFDTLKLMEAGADGAVMVGDSESDIGAAVAADVASVAVSFGYCHVPLAELGADAVIDDLSTLPETLTAILDRRSAS